MDWNRVQGNWKQVAGKVKAKWGKLTDDDLTAINGRREELEGKIQERYGIARDQARKDVDAWFKCEREYGYVEETTFGFGHYWALGCCRNSPSNDLGGCPPQRVP